MTNNTAPDISDATQDLFALDAVVAGLPAGALVDRLLPQPPVTQPFKAVVVAPPGTGKTTVVPPAVANRQALLHRTGRVVVTQPRRMAARAAARRLASLTGSKLGDVVGYSVRGDQKVSAATRVEFVTTGVLLRRLIRNPDAPGISAIIMDEVHERQLDTDLTFAMVHELVHLRDDNDPLDLVVMSATLDAKFWGDLLGDYVSVLSVEAKTYPLTETWAPLPGAGRAFDPRGVTSTFLGHVADTVVDTLVQEPVGDMLVFLPGAREIRHVQRILVQRFNTENTQVLSLLGSTPPKEQDHILRPPNEQQPRRVVLATNVAESALTVPGVRIVVDAGLDRQPRLDTIRGVAGLVTVGAAKSSMIQRAGRAAREAPGLVVRCMSDAEFAARPAHRPAEVRTADLTQAVLDLACWGATDGTGLQLPEPLPDRALSSAVAVLQQLGALDDHQKVTELGRKLALLPIDPRLGRALYEGAAFVGGHLAAEVVATLASDEQADGGDLTGLVRRLRAERPQPWVRDVQRLSQDLPADTLGSGGPLDPLQLGIVTALAYPTHIGRRRHRADGTAEYLLASGTAAELPHGSALQGVEWLAIADLTLHGDRALIRLAAELDLEHAELLAGSLVQHETVARFQSHKVTARAVHRIGAIEISSTPVQPAVELTRQAVVQAITQQGVLQFFGVETTPRHADAAALRARLGVLHRVLGAPWPDVSDAALTASINDWLGPELDQLATGTRADQVDLSVAFRRLLPWPEASRFDQLAPERMQVPSGAHIRLQWPAPEQHTAEELAPVVLAVKLQECFGWLETPTLVDGRVPVVLHLLSPAQRPLAITTDLANFWAEVYPQVRAENRGRYVKHPWPEDPLTAVATAKTNRALRKDQK